MDSYLVAVLLGGRSAEHSISILSARGVIPALLEAGHSVVAIGITRFGSWVHVDVDALLADSDPLPELPSTDEQIGVHWSEGRAVFTSSRGTVWLPDVAFPILHGPGGEDGSVQGLCETMGLPYVGSGVLGSACAMDKPVMKTILQAAGLPVGPWTTQPPSRWHGPVFVKPARAGSSIGITRVDEPDDLARAIHLAQEHDHRIIIEDAFDHPREIECGLLEEIPGEVRASVCAEISVRDGFYDFDAKYRSDVATLTVPADIPSDVQARIQELAIAAFRALDCAGFARADFFWLSDGAIMINEINTIPGFTPISMFPRMWQASGMSYVSLVDTLVRSAFR